MEKSIYTTQQKRLKELLRQLRGEAGLRQIDMAERLGVPQSFVSKYESGERRLDILELRAVCVALRISLEEFARRLDEVLSDLPGQES
jgi:transcriptional regulator with XRE-family HTH domain